MVIRLVEYRWTNEDDSGLDNPKIISTYRDDNIDKTIILIKEMMDHGVRVGDKWYTICDVIWNFPENHEYVPSIDVYVVDYYEVD